MFDCCPVAATFPIDGEPQNAGDVYDILDDDEAKMFTPIINAADNKPGHDPAIRARLLEPLEGKK